MTLEQLKRRVERGQAIRVHEWRPHPKMSDYGHPALSFGLWPGETIRPHDVEVIRGYLDTSRYALYVKDGQGTIYRIENSTNE